MIFKANTRHPRGANNNLRFTHNRNDEVRGFCATVRSTFAVDRCRYYYKGQTVETADYCYAELCVRGHMPLGRFSHVNSADGSTWRHVAAAGQIEFSQLALSRHINSHRLNGSQRPRAPIQYCSGGGGESARKSFRINFHGTAAAAVPAFFSCTLMREYC